MSQNFEALISDIKQCNEQIYNLALPVNDVEDKSDDDSQWLKATQLLQHRALLLTQLSSIINSLNQQQIEIVGLLYQSMLATDEKHLGLVQAEKIKVRNSLRSIKNAEKALPAYKAYNSNS